MIFCLMMAFLAFLLASRKCKEDWHCFVAAGIALVLSIIVQVAKSITLSVILFAPLILMVFWELIKITFSREHRCKPQKRTREEQEWLDAQTTKKHKAIVYGILFGLVILLIIGISLYK